MLDLLALADAERDAPAVLEAETGASWSYGRLGQAVDVLGEGLSGTKAMVLLLVRRDVPSLVAYLAALRGDHALLPVEADLDSGLLRALVELYQPEWVVGGGPDIAPHLDGAFAGYGPPEELWQGLHLLRRPSADAAPLHPELSLLLSTSGSTGSPKLVRLSAGNVVANARGIRAALGIDATQRAITSLPWSYSFGLSVVNSHLLAGGCLVTTERSLVSREFWDQARSCEATSFYGVPYMYEMLRRVGFGRMELPSLRVLAQAGGKLGIDLIQEFSEVMERSGGRFFVMYGQTEATARISVLPAEALARKPGSVGLPLQDGSIEILLPDGNRADGPGQEGEVIYSGPNVMLGYSDRRADLSRGDELSGRLATGDLGLLDEEGFLYITGRMKRFAKVFGLRMNLDEVEGHLHGAGMVAALEGPERIWLCCRPEAEAPVRAALDQLAGRLRVHRSAFEVRQVEDIPLLSNGKIDYGSLRATVLQDGGASSPPRS